MKFKKYKIKVDPKTIGDMELEYLTPEEREKRWERVREAIKNDEQPYEVEVEIEESSFLDSDKSTSNKNSCVSHKIVIWDTSKEDII